MARQRKQETNGQQVAETPAPAGEEAQHEERALTKLDQAKAKLERMETINKICFRHQNDLGKIEDELKEKFKVTDNELDFILQPKGQKNIPGFGFQELQRQKQYVNYLSARERKGNGEGHTAAEDQRRDETTEQGRDF